MKKRHVLPFISLLIFSLVTFGCKKKKFKSIDPEFISYVSSYTSGLISSQSSIKIQLVKANNEITPGDEAKNLFSFHPKIKGKATWLTHRIIEFTPNQPLKSGTIYEVNFNLSKLQKVPKAFENFSYNFQVIPQFVDVQLKSVTAEDDQLTLQKITGTIETADVISEEQLSKIFSAQLSKKEYPVIITKSNVNNRYNFEIKHLPRSKKNNQLTVSWDGAPIHLNLSGSLNVEIPALGAFKVLQTRIYHQPEQYVSILFSDPLDPYQNLNGLVWFRGKKTPKFTIDNNEIKVFPNSKLKGKQKLIIHKVKNKLQKKLPHKKLISLEFTDIKPGLELLGKGIILPNNKGIKFPFKSVNLKAVNIKIVKIFEDNIAQFLQVNQLDGNREIQRVGRTVYQNTLTLKADKPIDYSKWNTFSIQLNSLIDPEPGAIYRIELSYGKRHSFYPCSTEVNSNTSKFTSNNDDTWDNEPAERSSWDYYENNNHSNYDYSQRHNPCNDAYYSYHTTKVVRNVLASNMGVITKLGTNNTMTVAVTDLLTTQPIEDTQLEVLNYQQQKIASATTNSSGLAELKIPQKPFLLIASKEKQKAYLRLDNGSSLSTSKFDVSGAVNQKGIKGFIYGERGVWRPGDTLFLNFILQDKNRLLPKTHPVNYELINPQGQVVVSKTKTTAVGNIYNFTTPTLENYVTGNWTARIKVGGAIFSKRIKIETVKPNRLKVNLDFGVKKLSVKNKKIKGTLSSKWLHGAIAKNLKADIKVSMSQTQTTFPKFSDYIFDDPGHFYETENQEIFNGNLNHEGKASINTRINVNNSAPGMLNANFRIRVFEKGGDFSYDNFTIPYAPYTSFVGVKLPKGDQARGMLLTDVSHPVKIATLDPEGRPVNTKVRIDVYKLQWKYWWEKNSNEDLSNYVGSTYKKPIHTSYTTSSNGLASSSFEIKYPDWGRYYVRVTNQSSGHATGKIVYIDWPGWAGRASKENPGGASMLVFNTDKPKYNVGEEVKVTLPTSENSKALISIESGSKVVETYWIETQKKTTQFSFKTTPEMAPNVYVNVTLIQPHQYEGNDLPIRLYGMVPISVENPKTHLSPVLEMPNELHPEEIVTLKVSETHKKPMAYTVAVVDEGLLNITRFKTPNAWHTFYAREALGVRTWDMYDYVMGASAGNISGLLQIGGDDYNKKNGAKKNNRFKPVVKFMGPFYLEASQKNTHRFKMPQYVGSVKTMVVASDTEAYGATSKATPVKQPLMVLSSLPRVLSPNEEVKVPVNVFTMDDALKNVAVSIKTKGVTKVIGSTKNFLKFNTAGEQITIFNLKTPNKIGASQIEITAVANGITAKHTIDIAVRLPNPPISHIQEKVLQPQEIWNSNYQLNGIQGTQSAYLELSSIPAINLEERLNYLVKYPHGCAEQTTSSGFPQLFLADITNLTASYQQEINQNIKATINRLLQFQHSNGGFVYWPSHLKTHDWATSYVGHFLLEAKFKGYDIPVNVLSKWTSFQKKQANSWSASTQNSRHDLLQAYRLYTLALANQAALGAMNRLKEKEDLSLQATWRLAAAYAVLGQKEIANEIIFGKSLEIPAYKEMGHSFGSDIRDKAMILETLTLLDQKEKAANLLTVLANALSSKQWMSTQTTAYTLTAISKFISGNTSIAQKQISYSYQLNHEKEKTVAGKKSAIIKEILPIKKSENQIQLKNNSDGVLFVKLVTKEVASTKASNDENNNLEMKVVYYDLNNNIITPEALTQGSDFKIEVTLKNNSFKGDYKQLALTQLFPSGWEIQNIRTDKTGNKHLKSTADYMDIRDDRIYYYFDLKQGEQKTFVSLLNAAYLGKFYLPSVYCEAMYDQTINAKKSGKWVSVIK